MSLTAQNCLSGSNHTRKSESHIDIPTSLKPSLSESFLLSIFSEFGETDHEMLEAAVKRFVRSCAGYSVATYVLVSMQVAIKYYKIKSSVFLSHDYHVTYRA